MAKCRMTTELWKLIDERAAAKHCEQSQFIWPSVVLTADQVPVEGQVKLKNLLDA